MPKKIATKKKPTKVIAVFARYKKRISDYLARRPHRSFQLTRRRDVPAGPVMPGLIVFTKSVFDTLWKDKRLFGSLVAFISIIGILLVGIVQQDQFATSAEVLREYNKLIAEEGVDGATQVGLLFASAATGGLNASLTEAQQIYLSLLYLFGWLVTIWLLRHRLAGTAVKLRDGLYNAGAPVIAILALLSLAILQLLPLALGIFAFSAASGSEGLLNGGIEAGLFAFVALLLAVLSLYWVSSTLFAIIIATIPGTYPMQALRSAGDLVIGQRSRLMIRIAWLLVVIALLWAVVLLPAIALDSWLAQSWLPITVVTVQLLTGFSVIFGSAYIYLLYRKMIDEPAK